MLIYNTATVGDVTPGFYFWNETLWTRFSTGEYIFQNGLTENSQIVELGGDLSDDTEINFSNFFSLTFNIAGSGSFNIKNGANDMVVFKNDGNVQFINDISVGEYINFENTPGISGYGFRQRSSVLEYKKNTSQDWTAFPDAPPNGETMWWYKPTSATYIRPQDNANVRIYDDTETYGFYYDGSSNQYGGYFKTSSSVGTTSAVVGFSDVLDNETRGFLGYNGTYDSGTGLELDGTAVYGLVEDKNRASIFGRTTKDASVAAIIGYSDVWISGYYFTYDGNNDTKSHPALYGQLIVESDKADNQSAIKGYSEYTNATTDNRGVTVGGEFISKGNEQDAKGIRIYTMSTGLEAIGANITVDDAETVYGIYVKAGTDGETTDATAIFASAETSDGDGIIGLGADCSIISYTGYGDGIIGGSDNGVGVYGYFYDGSNVYSKGYLGYDEVTANYFYHYEEIADGDGQAAIEGYRNRDNTIQNAGLGYDYGETNQAIQGYDRYSDEYAFAITGHSYCNYDRSGGVLGAEHNPTSFWEH